MSLEAMTWFPRLLILLEKRVFRVIWKRYYHLCGVCACLRGVIDSCTLQGSFKNSCIVAPNWCLYRPELDDAGR